MSLEIFYGQMILGYIIDLLVGDPSKLPHPVVLIGKIIERLEKTIRSMNLRPPALQAAGACLALAVVTVSFVAVHLLLQVALQVHYYLYLFLGAWIVSTTIATKGLADAAQDIRRLLAAGRLDDARIRVGWIVSRDTDNMDSRDITRATVETVAENLVDAVVAPVFYACIGGPALAMAYRAVNTLDSMLGYKNEKYIYLGWASARLDDAAGYIPARLTGCILVCAAWLSNRKWRGALAAWRQDAAAHPSPNSGIPESVMAGALGIRLGGRNVYGGVVSFRPYMGEPLESLRPDHINRAVDMLYLASLLAVMACAAPVLVLF